MNTKEALETPIGKEAIEKALKQKPQAPSPKESQARVPEPNLSLYRANLDCLVPKILELPKLLAENPEKPLAIDSVEIKGLKNPMLCIIVGFSSLRILDQIRSLKRKEVSSIVIIEPDLGIFHQTIRREWVGWILDDPRIDLVVGVPVQELLPHLTRIFTAVHPKYGARASRCATPEVVADPFAYPTHPETGEQHPLVQQVIQISSQAVKQVFTSMGCAPDSHMRWVQTIRNEKNLQSTYRIEPLFKQFAEVPAIVLGAGPSLETFIDAYHRLDLRERALLIACDASLRKLLHHGIRPHIVTRCERKLTTIFRDLEKSQTQGIYYAAYPWCSPEYFDLFESSFMLFRDNGLCKWSGYDPGSVNGGVSSANAGVELAFLLGCKTIILSGIDLAFLDGKSHVDGTEVEFDPEKSRAKWTEIKANDGSKVTSIPVWLRCLNEYQGTIFKHQGKNARVYNTSLKGAEIPGATYKGWNSLVPDLQEKFDIPKKISSRLEKHTQGYEESYLQKKKETIAFLEEVANELEKVQKNAEDCLRTGYFEEEKVIGKIKTITNPHAFFSSMLAMQKELIRLFAEPCRQIDTFRLKYYNMPLFSHIIMDICQLDLFQSENKYYALVNLLEIEHERLKYYVDIHLRLFKVFEFYTRKLLDLLKNGYSGELPDLEDPYVLAGYPGAKGEE